MKRKFLHTYNAPISLIWCKLAIYECTPLDTHDDIYLVPDTAVEEIILKKSEIVGVKKNMVDDIHVWDIEDVKTKYIFPVPVSSAEKVSQDQTKPVSLCNTL